MEELKKLSINLAYHQLSEGDILILVEGIKNLRNLTHLTIDLSQQSFINIYDLFKSVVSSKQTIVEINFNIYNTYDASHEYEYMKPPECDFESLTALNTIKLTTSKLKGKTFDYIFDGIFLLKK